MSRAIVVMLLAVLMSASLTVARADGPPPGPLAVPPPGSGPIVQGPPLRVDRGPVDPRLYRLEQREHWLKRHIWRLRIRRRQFLVEGLPGRAHRAHERILNLGWQLRRVEWQERRLER